MVDYGVLIQLAFATALAAASVYFAVRWMRPGDYMRDATGLGQITFLFDGTQLIDATQPAFDLMQTGENHASDFDRFLAALAPRFPDLPQTMGQIADFGEKRLLPRDGGDSEIRVEYLNGVTRVSLVSNDQETAARVSDEIKQKTLQDELGMLRNIVNEAQQLMWRTGASGQLVWANTAYMDLSERIHGPSDQWPPKPIFEDLPDNGETTRLAVLPKDGADMLWFDLRAQSSGVGQFFTAHDVSDMIRADDIQQDLMQTLTKTFAGLAIGMAVFDRKRQLIMFNPSLSDLTGLKPTDLLARPQIQSFLDLLRESRVMPEPRNYGKWREEMAAIEAAALSGDYVETWPLPDGRTFRITGRPFPSGSIALFFEDITEGITKDRRMTAALRMAQDALDGAHDAIAIFAPNGGPMLLSNTAFRRYWGEIVSKDGKPPTLEQLCRRWRSKTTACPHWDELTDKSYRCAGPRLCFDTIRSDGVETQVTARHLQDGSMSIMFSEKTMSRDMSDRALAAV